MTTTEIFNDMKNFWTEFEEQHEKFATKGNKSAGSKARKAIGELKKLVTEYRKVSITEAKQ